MKDQGCNCSKSYNSYTLDSHRNYSNYMKCNSHSSASMVMCLCVWGIGWKILSSSWSFCFFCPFWAVWRVSLLNDRLICWFWQRFLLGLHIRFWEVASNFHLYTTNPHQSLNCRITFTFSKRYLLGSIIVKTLADQDHQPTSYRNSISPSFPRS